MTQLLSIGEIFDDALEYMSRLEIEVKRSEDGGPGGTIRFDTPNREQLIAQQWYAPGIDLVVDVKARQVGRSTQEQANVQARCHTSRVPHRVLVMTNHQTTTDGWIRRAEVFRDGMPKALLRQAPMNINLGKSVIKFPLNNSIINLELAGGKSQGRGGTYDGFVGEEVGFWRNAREVYAAATNALSDDTPIHLISTPSGPGTLYHEKVLYAQRRMELGDPRVKLNFFPWFLHHSYQKAPPPDWEPTQAEVDFALLHGLDLGADGELVSVKDMRRLYWRHDRIWGARGIGENLFRREYPSTLEEGFLDWKGGWYDTAYINSLLAVHIGQEITGELRIYRRPEAGELYAIGADPSWCVGGDYFAAVVMDSRGRVCAVLHTNKGGEIRAAQMLSRLAGVYNKALVLVEANTGGAGPVILRLLQSEGVKVWCTWDNGKQKFWTTVGGTAGNKALAYSHSRQMVNAGGHDIPDLPLLRELLAIREEKGRIEGQDGNHDDLADALVLAEQCRLALPNAEVLRPQRHKLTKKATPKAAHARIQEVLR